MKNYMKKVVVGLITTCCIFAISFVNPVNIKAEEPVSTFETEGEKVSNESEDTSLDEILPDETEQKKQEIENALQELTQAQNTVKEKETALENATNEYNQKVEAYEAAKKVADEKGLANTEAQDALKKAQADVETAKTALNNKSNELDTAKTNTANIANDLAEANKQLEDAKKLLAQAQAVYDKGALGFYETMAQTDESAKRALEILNYSANNKFEKGNISAIPTELGKEGDATNLENVKETMLYLQKANEKRAELGLTEFGVSNKMMAIAQVRANLSSYTGDHENDWLYDNLNNNYQGSENLSGTVFHSSNGAEEVNAQFEGWVDEEKGRYDKCKEAYEAKVAELDTKYKEDLANLDKQLEDGSIDQDNYNAQKSALDKGLVKSKQNAELAFNDDVSKNHAGHYRNFISNGDATVNQAETPFESVITGVGFAKNDPNNSSVPNGLKQSNVVVQNFQSSTMSLLEGEKTYTVDQYVKMFTDYYNSVMQGINDANTKIKEIEKRIEFLSQDDPYEVAKLEKELQSAKDSLVSFEGVATQAGLTAQDTQAEYDTAYADQLSKENDKNTAEGAKNDAQKELDNANTALKEIEKVLDSLIGDTIIYLDKDVFRNTVEDILVNTEKANLYFGSIDDYSNLSSTPYTTIGTANYYSVYVNKDGSTSNIYIICKSGRKVHFPEDCSDYFAVLKNSNFSKIKNIEFKNIDAEHIENATSMFEKLSLQDTLDLSGFNTRNATTLKSMFKQFQGTTIIFDGFNTSSVTNMEEMFSNCINIVELDLSSFNTSAVTYMGGMFGGCENLKTIYATEKFVTDKFDGANEMFNRNNQLVGGNGTKYCDELDNSSKYARIDTLEHKGYFTKKGYVIPDNIKFTDVDETTAHYEDIMWLAGMGISKGWDVGNNEKEFRPYNDVARCDMAAFIRRLAQKYNLLDSNTWTPSESDWNTFIDIDKNSPHAEDVLWLAHAGISAGWDVGNGRKEFRPLVSVARCDMAAFIRRLAAKASIGDANTWEPYEFDWYKFVDIDKNSPHAEDVLWLAHSGISKGWDIGNGIKEFRSLTNVARCDMAAFLQRLANLR